MKQESNEKKLESILKEFSTQGELVKNLGDALAHIILDGHFNENGEWEEPEWKRDVLKDIAQARELIKKSYELALNMQDEQSEGVA